jgi:hypothetical protein
MRRLFQTLADYHAAQRRKNQGLTDAEVAEAMKREQERLARLERHKDLVARINERMKADEH